MFISLKRILKLGFLNFRGQATLATATICIVSIVIILATALFLLQKPAQFLVSALQQRIHVVTVYFADEASEQDIQRVKSQLAESSLVREVTLVSKEEALDKFNREYKDNSTIQESLAVVGKNPLPASLVITTWKASQCEAIVNLLKQGPSANIISDIYYPKNALKNLSTILSYLNIGAIALVAGFTFLAILIVFSAIKLAIYTAQEKISFMRLTGASNWFIEGPFIVQGAVIGLLCVSITMLIYGGALFLLDPKIEALLPGLHLFDYFKSSFVDILLIQLAVGVGLTIPATLFAIRKYLKV